MQQNRRNNRRSRGRGRYNNRRQTTRYRPQNFNFTYGNMVDKMGKDLTRVMSLLNTEFKSIDLAASGTVSTTAGIVLLNGTAPGDDFDTRDGRQARMKSIQITLTYFINSSATLTFIRIIVFIDKQPNEVTPTAVQLLDVGDIVSLRNLDFRKRFVILKDDIVTMSDAGEKLGSWKFYKKIDTKTQYDAGTAGTIADITTNALFLLLVSSEATNTPNVTRVSRVRFIDN